jgi:hypothetical protein
MTFKIFICKLLDGDVEPRCFLSSRPSTVTTAAGIRHNAKRDYALEQVTGLQSFLKREEVGQ